MPDETQQKTCDVDGCSEPATVNYSWDWGQHGVACARCLTLLQQKSTQLNRTIMSTAMAPTQTAPLERDERCKLVARALVLEEEITEAKLRGLELYRKVGELTQQVQTHVLREREANAQINDGLRRVATLEEKVEQRDRELAELVAELERLRTLEAFMQGMTATPAPATPADELTEI